MTLKIINLTPHDIVIDGDTIKKSGRVARVQRDSMFKLNQYANGYPVYYLTFRNTTYNLPRRRKGTMFIVSAIVREANPKRRDIYSPSHLVYNNDGQVIGCEGFLRNP